MANLLRQSKETNIHLYTQDAIDYHPDLKSDVIKLSEYLSIQNPLSSKVFVLAGPSFAIDLLQEEVDELTLEIAATNPKEESIVQESSDVLFFSILPRLLYNGRFTPAQKTQAEDAYQHAKKVLKERNIPVEGQLTKVLETKNLINYPKQVFGGSIPGETDEKVIERYEGSLKIVKALRALMPNRKLTPDLSQAIVVNHQKRIIGIDVAKLNGSSKIIFNALSEGILPVPLLVINNGQIRD